MQNLMPRGYRICVSRCVREGKLCLQRTHYGTYQYIRVGITLLVSTHGCGRPQMADWQKMDTHVFCDLDRMLNN